MSMRPVVIFLLAAIWLAGCTASGSPPMTTGIQADRTSPATPTQVLFPSATSTPGLTPLQPVPAPGNPYAPKPGDKSLVTANVIITEASIYKGVGDPVQMMLSLQGSLPTPCNELRVVIETNAQNQTNIQVYSLSDPKKMCIEIISPFDVKIPLGVYPSGHYTVSVNGEIVGEFDS